MSLSFAKLEELRLLMETDRDVFRDYIDQELARTNVSNLPGEGANSRTVGVFLGGSPNLPGSVSVGLEGQVMLAYDTQTNQTGIYFYTGLTAGVALPLNGLPTLPVNGVFLFDGAIHELKGLQGGGQGAAGAAVGWSATPSGNVMIQVGQEVDMNIELTGGYTWEIWADKPQIDWDLTEARIRKIFADNPTKITEILTDIAIHEDIYNDALNDEFVEKYGFLAVVDESCFLAGTMIELWPVDAQIEPEPDGIYNETDLLDQITRKPIEQIKTDDIIVSFDTKGRLVPGRVSRTFINHAKIVLDFFGTGVTPGHVYYRADSDRPAKFETLIDILCDDGVIETSDGVHIRAATGLSLGEFGDQMVQTVTGQRGLDGVSVIDQGPLRVGTRFITDDGQDFCIADMITASGGILTDDGLIQIGKQAPIPFHWEFSDLLPRPEDYVLKRSGTTLEQIFKADEWEEQRPVMSAPLALESGPVMPLLQSEKDNMAPNVHLKNSNASYNAAVRPNLTVQPSKRTV